MTRTLRILLLFVFTGLTGSAFAQEISGRILDEKKEPLPSAVIQVFQGGINKGGAAADYDGNYTIKPLDPGFYDVLIRYSGYDSILETGVVVTAGARTTRNYTMAKPNGKELATVVVRAFVKPLIDQDDPSKHVMTRTEIANVPTTEITDLVSLSAGLYQAQRGSAISIGGARSDGTLYIIDGVQVQGTIGVNMSQGSVDQLEVLTSGIPANYGDVSGGVVNITSRGVQPKMTGSIRVQHSIDGYKNNLASFSIAGPIYKKRIKGDSLHKKPVLGFALSGDFYDDKDRYPSYYNQYQAKGDALANLQQNPLKIISDNTGATKYKYAAEYMTLNDLQQVKVPDNNEILEARLNGKVNLQINDNLGIVAGGSFGYIKQDQYSRALAFYSPQAIPTLNTTSARGFIRFTQKFGKSNYATDTSAKQSIISNAYYSIQADYQLSARSQENPDFKKNIFDYGYVGKFTENRMNIYSPLTKDSATGRTGTVLILNTTPDGFAYQRSEMNPVLANYTSQYYNSLNGLKPFTISQLQSQNAIANGDQPAAVYGLVNGPGQTITGYSNVRSDQYALSVDASFDLLIGKTKHAIGFGLYYQQRVERSYYATSNYNNGTNTLWAQMRALVSSVDNTNLKLDKTNPIFRVNGQSYTAADIAAGKVVPGISDTIIYNYTNIGSGLNNGLGTQFDQNLRKKLGLTNNQDINIDALDPSTFSLDMFTADELLASGHPFVGYQGYTYTGGTQGTVNFNDFWTAKDANGNYTRPVAAFSPNYIAGYLMDKFSYKDIHFNIGVRVDRYSSNTKVLTDPYSLYAEKSVGQVSGANNTINGGTHPSNIGNGYVVYVDDNSSSSPSIIGYRNGTSWYDAKGQYIEDPSVLKNYSNGRNPEPYLVKNANGSVPSITDTNFNPNNSFTDYTPQVSVQPRLSFNFPISDVADFYAHYDIYSQRPTSNSYSTPVDYYYLQQNANSIINNSALRPQRTFDYEVGFQQKLTDHSSLTLSASYKERKDMISVVPYIYAWPTTYYTYGNRDFSTTKGTTLTYDMRATNHLTMNIAYTLQFAEGTGSTANSTNGNGSSNGQISPNGLLQSFLQAGLPNLRYVYALDYDSRHVIKANISYRYNDGEGPIIGGKNIFQNAGITLIPSARSGEPYTRFLDAVGNTVVGGVNGSRLPWHYGVDLRVDKEFALAFGKRQKDAPEGVKLRRPLSLRAVLQVNNLLNTRDVLGVYGYTGKPDDNGYLTSSYGRQAIPQQTNPQSYVDLYSILYNSPGNYNYHRTASIALEFNF